MVDDGNGNVEDQNFMANYDHLPLFKSAFTLCLEMYKITKNFGREYKYTLGERIKEKSHVMLDIIIETNSLDNVRKVNSLRKLLLETEKLKMCLRISCHLKLISPKALGKSAENIEEICKQSYGWMNYASKVVK